MKKFSLPSIKTKTDELSEVLVKAVNSPILTYSEIREVDHQGLYIIFADKEILYVGRTPQKVRKIRQSHLLDGEKYFEALILSIAKNDYLTM